MGGYWAQKGSQAGHEAIFSASNSFTHPETNGCFINYVCMILLVDYSS